MRYHMSGQHHVKTLATNLGIIEKPISELKFVSSNDYNVLAIEILGYIIT